MPSPRILVLDANQRSALAVTRSLGKINELQISTADSTREALAGFSKFSQKYYRHPDINQAPNEFLDWLNNILSSESIDAIFPCTEVSSRFIAMNRSALGKCNIPFAPLETVLKLSDKAELVELGQSLGINVPESKLFANRGALNQADFGGLGRFPLVIKPSLSKIWTGTAWLSTEVKIVYSSNELLAHLDSNAYFDQYPFLIQEFIPGSGAGIFALYDSGNPVAFFAHKRLREKPPSGGVSVLCESVSCDPVLLAQAKKLLSGVSWHGVAMVEFRVTPEGVGYLMEVNTRFWGSLQLAIDSGVDFPALLYKITMKQPVGVGSGYTVGQRLRWLLGDIDSLYLALRSNALSTKQKIRLVGNFCWPQPLQTRHEINRLSDMGPAWFELKQYLANLRR